MKKILALMLMLLPLVGFVSCNKDDEPDKDGFFMPITKWGASPSYVIKQESHNLISNEYDPTEDYREITFEGGRNVIAVIYGFENEELEQSALGMKSSDLDDFEDWVEDKGYEEFFEYQGVEFYASKDGKTLLLIGEDDGIGVGIFCDASLYDDIMSAPKRAKAENAAVKMISDYAKKMK